VRYRKEHQAQIHNLIVVAASRKLRSRGVEAINIAEVMKSVGLTHGGFYAHFSDRSAMICEAVQSAMTESSENFKKLTGLARQANRHSIIVEYYLSDMRVSDIENGCPAAALANEINRLPENAKRKFSAGLKETLSILEDYFGSCLIANAALALLVGSLNLMRSTDDATLRAQIKRASIQQFDFYPERKKV
jgi:TetR/AcrR family transcriptional repressor of nem operon